MVHIDKYAINSPINKVLFFILIIVLVTTIRVYPLYQNSLEPTSYEGPSVKRLDYLLENGHSLPAERGEIILDKLSAIKILIINPSPKQNLLLNSFQLSLSYSLLMLLFAKTPNQKRNLTLLSGWNSPYTWIFLWSSIYILLYKKRNVINTFLFIFFLLLIPPVYFTFSLFTAFLVVTCFFFQILSGRKIFSNTIIILYIVFLLTWTMHESQMGFSFILNFIDYAHSFVQEESRSVELRYILGGTIFSVIEHAISIALASIPLLYVIIKRKRVFDSRTHDFLVVYVMSCMLFSIVFYLWMGITGIFQRIPLYISLASISSFSLLSTSNIRKQHQTTLLSIILVAIIFTNFIYITSEYTRQKPSFNEAAGAHWLMDRMSKEDLIFTDLRLSATFISNGYLTIGVPDHILDPLTVNKLLEGIFYDPSTPDQVFRGMSKDGKDIKYIYFSKVYTSTYPAIMGFDYNYQPAPKDYLNRYNNIKEFDLIYQNSDISIFKRVAIG
jgi:hypothetical protein